MSTIKTEYILIGAVALFLLTRKGGAYAQGTGQIRPQGAASAPYRGNQSITDPAQVAGGIGGFFGGLINGALKGRSGASGNTPGIVPQSAVTDDVYTVGDTTWFGGPPPAYSWDGNATPAFDGGDGRFGSYVDNIA